jgi:hypothetical protein
MPVMALAVTGALEACKYKWQTLLPKYKRVADVRKETGVNSTVYFEMSFRERKKKNLPKNFDHYVYRDMHEWLKHKLTMNPPHFRDLLSPSDGNYRAPPVTAEGVPLDANLQPHPLPKPPSTSPLHAYNSAAAYDVAAEEVQDGSDTPQETKVSPEGNQTMPTFPTPPLHSLGG